MLALSLSNSVTEVGALAAFAALLGIAVLSLLVFSQAREIKRLREWAGRAPERAVEMEQRVSADAAARVRGTGAPAGPVAQAVRVVERKTPLVSAPVSTAVNATVAAVVPAAGVPSVPDPAPTPDAGAGVSATAAATTAPPPGEQDSKPVEGVAAAAPRAVAVGPEATAGQSARTVAETAEPVAQPTNPEPAKPSPAVAPRPGGPPDVVSQSNATERPDVAEQPMTPAPATAAARAAGVSARPPLPPSPAAPAPPGAAPSSAAPAGAGSAAASPKPSSRAPAPAVAARSVPSRAVGKPVHGAAARSPSPPRVRASGAATSAGGRAVAQASGEPAGGGSGPKYFKPERSRGRATVLIVGGVIVGVLVLVLAVSALKGGGGSTPTATHSSSLKATEAPATSSHTTPSAVASNPAETAVVVLNGTGTAGLAHHLAADLQQGGYTRAAALAGVPPGTHATTVVQYTHGHRADALAVAKALNVSQVQAIESTIVSLAGSATVVVLAGADQASQLGGGGAQSNGEPAAGTAGSGQ